MISAPDVIRSQTFRLADDETKAFRADKLLALGWRARQKKKPLIILSSEGSAKSVLVQSCATHRTSYKPAVVDDYNKSMNGVDRADQYTVYYAFVRKSRKWWRKLYFWLYEVTTVNSYILYKLSVPSPVTHLQFRQSVVNALASRYISTAPPRPRPGHPPKRSLCDPERANTHQQHYLEKRAQRECVVCRKMAAIDVREQCTTALSAVVNPASALLLVLGSTTRTHHSSTDKKVT